MAPAKASDGTADGLAGAIVIPSHDEPDLLATLESLRGCERPLGRFEVRIVVNGSHEDPPEVRARNAATIHAVRSWAAERGGGTLAFEIVEALDLPPRHAGVGLARRIGMDAAAQRLAAAGRPRAPIVCLDADCTVAPNYLRGIEAHFAAHPRTPGCAIHFEHPLPADPRERAGIVGYELHLRAFVHGLRWAGHPHAYQTVGSSMAVRADVYRRQGGMNRRKAGEDFYFLHKVIPLGGFTELRATTVYPSARISRRVPFGTGRAMEVWRRSEDLEPTTYDPRVYADLGPFLEGLGDLDEPAAALLPSAPPVLRRFLADQGFEAALDEVRANAATAASRRARLFVWLNAFRVLKYVHLATAEAYPRVPVSRAARTIAEARGLDEGGDLDAEGWLDLYRRIDRGEIVSA